MEDYLRRKGFYSMTPERRREAFLQALKELQESFQGDPEAATEALYSSRGRGDAGSD